VTRVEFTPAAGDDLDDLVDFIARRNPTAAGEVRAAIVAAVTALAAPTPSLEGRAVTMQTGAPCRRWFVHPAVIYYERESGVLRILRVYHHAREPIVR